MKLQGEFEDNMCEVNLEYKEYVRYENGQKNFYLLILRAIYGCIKSALLWYNLYVKVLKAMCFNVNPYDICVANNTINGK